MKPDQLQKQIDSLEINSIALRKAADELDRKLDDVKKIRDRPASGVRRNLKNIRVADFERDFLMGKWKHKN